MELYDLLNEDPTASGHAHSRHLVDATDQLIDDLVRQRELSGLTQADVAKAMHTSQASVSRFEAGVSDVHLSTLRRYAKAVGAVFDFKVRRFRQDSIPAMEPWHWEVQVDSSRLGALK